MNFPPCLFVFTLPPALLTLHPAFSSLPQAVLSDTAHTQGGLMDKTSKATPAKTGGISRREFARRAALASAVATVAPATALTTTSSLLDGHTPGAAADRLSGAAKDSGYLPDPTGEAPQQTPELAKLSPESRAEVEARIQAIFAQYGNRFSEEQKADVRRLCAVAQPSLDRLRAYALENGDGPALYLKPLVEREKNPLEGTRVGKTPDAKKKS
jgi:hypothetical protein